MPLSRRYSPEWAPGEGCNLGMDFSSIIPPGVGIQLGQVEFLLNTASPTVTTDFQVGAVQVVGRTLLAFVSGGVSGRDYQVSWLAIDTEGNSWPRTGLLLCAPTS